MGAEERQAKRFGEFVVGELIGEGPRARVYKARRGGEPCALKILKSRALPKSGSHRQKLLQILQRLNTIDHPAVVKVMEAGERRGRFYVAMELMECPTLAERLQEEGQFPERDVVVIGRCIAQALEAGASANVLHGDLVLENVFAPVRNRVKVADFAIKRYIEEAPSDAALAQKPTAGTSSAVSEEKKASAEELLRSRVLSVTTEGYEKDLAALGTVMLSLFGVTVPAQGADEHVGEYCERLRKVALELKRPPYRVSGHTANVLDRLLSPGQFKSPGEAVAELASAAILQRTLRTAATAAGEEVGAGRPTGRKQTVRVPAPTGVAEKATGIHEQEPGEPRRGLAEVEREAEAGVLLLWRGGDRGEFFVLSEGTELVVGRDPYLCDVVIPESVASRRHCTVLKKGDKLHVNDPGSYHGTFVNGVRVQQADLAAGDVIRIGDTKITVEPSLPLG